MNRSNVSIASVTIFVFIIIALQMVSNTTAFYQKHPDTGKPSTTNSDTMNNNNDDEDDYYNEQHINEMTYYEILQIQPDSSLMDIKKAYRKLALQYHPDRNIGNEKQSEQIFRHVAEAYEVLSDPTSRKEYDNTVRLYGGTGRKNNAGNNNQYQYQQQHKYNSMYDQYNHHFGGRQFRDPFVQFNDLFQHDAFFKEAFAGMDDLFRETFEKQQQNQQQNHRTPTTTTTTTSSSGSSGAGGGGFFGNILNRLGIHLEIQTSSSNSRGETKLSSTSYGGGGGGAGAGGGGGLHNRNIMNPYNNNNNNNMFPQNFGTTTYTSKSTSTIFDSQGRKVTIQSMEKDGNRIEEKYINNQLIERKINGKITDVQQIMPPSESSEF